MGPGGRPRTNRLDHCYPNCRCAPTEVYDRDGSGVQGRALVVNSPSLRQVQVDPDLRIMLYGSRPGQTYADIECTVLVESLQQPLVRDPPGSRAFGGSERFKDVIVSNNMELSQTMLIVLALAAAAVSIVWAIIQSNRGSNLPRVGKAGLIGYISTVLRFTIGADVVVQEGTVRFAGRPFIIPTLSGSRVIVGPEHIELLRKSNDTVFNQPEFVNESLQLDHTMNPQQMKNPFHVAVVRSDITRAIASFIPEMLEEMQLAMQDTFDPCRDASPAKLPVFKTLTYMIGRISNRAMLGTELCRNEGFIRAIVHFAETMVPYSRILRFLPRFMRPTIYLILSSIFGGQKEPKKYIIPYLKRHIKQRETTGEKSNTIAEFLIQHSDLTNLDDLAMRIMNLNFASIHTSSIFLTQALFELSILPEPDVERIRAEVREALEIEGGWSKATLARCRMIDSLLREVGRFHGLGVLGMARFTTRDGELEDGTRIPAGYTVAFNLKAIHFNPEVYPNPHVFDAFRFSNLRKEENSDVKHGFTTVDSNYIPFALGRHTCPGRFFAAMELKMMIAHLLLNYEFSLPPGVTERPKNLILDAAKIPDIKAQLVFKRKHDLPRS